jgi:autotransporter-associated beta strand protein
VKTGTAVITLLALLHVPALAVEPEDLYTRVGTDPTFQQLIDSGVIVPGVSAAPGPVNGSVINVDNALLEQQTGVPGSIPQDIRIHTQVNSSISRSNFSKFTRWYQEDGKVQVMRLFQGEQNVRSGVGPTGTPGRIEAFYPTFTVQPNTWSVWEGTYTIIDPLSANIFQLFHDGGQLWPFHLRMTSTGNITFNRRQDIPGLPKDITVATNMAGKSIRFRVRANGYNYEVYKRIPLVDTAWELVTVGSYTPAVDNKISFRWGMYHGSQAGQSIPENGLLFVSGVTRTTSTAPGVDPPPPPPPPVTYYWDNNGATSGFGTASGVWGETTTGNGTQGWSEDVTGATLPVDVSTTSADPVFFGTNTTGGGLGSGTITVSDTVSCANMTFGSQSGNITLSGGEIEMSGSRVITVAGTGKSHTVGSLLSGTGSRGIAGGSTLSLVGENTFDGTLTLGDNTNANLRLRFNSVKDVGAGPSSLGAPLTAANGIIQIGSGSFGSTMEFANAIAPQATDRQVRIGSSSNGSGGSSILNNNADPAHTLTFSNPAFNVAATNISSTNRTLTLGGTNPGNNTISGTIIDNIGGSSGKVGLTKSGTGTWILAGATNTYSNPTNVNAGTLKMGSHDPLPSGAGRSNVSVNGGANAGSAGTLDLAGFNLSINGLAGSSGTVAGLVVNDAAATVSTLTLGNNNAGSTFNGVLADGAGTLALTKTGSGAQTLNGPNTHSGPTAIQQGTLALGANGSISPSSVTIHPGAFLDTTARAIHILTAASPLVFRVDPAGPGSSGTLVAAGLDITTASVAFDLVASLDDAVYVLATYTSLTGTAFANIVQPPAGYSIDYARDGDKIALVRNPSPVPVVLFSDNFDGDPAAALNGTTPDITTGADWVAMNSATNGRIRADGTLDVSGGVSADRGGSATLAFAPQDGFIYMLDLSALNLNSSASNTTANRLYFGFAKGQSAGNGSGNRLQVADATVQGQITQGFMTKVGYSTTTNPNPGLGGIESASFNDASSTTEWTALATAFGGGIDLRIVLDTSIPGSWTATWYAKRPTSQNYSVTRATEVVNTQDITSVGFGLNTFTSGRVSAFTLTRADPATAFLYEIWANGAAFDGDANGDGVSNGLAFLLGADDPATNALGLLPAFQDTNGGLRLTFNVRNPASRGSAMLNLQHSNDLGISDPWTSVAVPDEQGATLSGGVMFSISPIQGTSRHSVQATIPVSEAADGKLFGRLSAVSP